MLTSFFISESYEAHSYLDDFALALISFVWNAFIPKSSCWALSPPTIVNSDTSSIRHVLLTSTFLSKAYLPPNTHTHPTPSGIAMCNYLFICLFTLYYRLFYQIVGSMGRGNLSLLFNAIFPQQRSMQQIRKTETK